VSSGRGKRSRRKQEEEEEERSLSKSSLLSKTLNDQACLKGPEGSSGGSPDSGTSLPFHLSFLCLLTDQARS
jgi:hypothetical protein